MVDFSALMKSPAGVAPKPKALPMMTAHGLIKSFEVLPAPEGKEYSAIIRFHVGLTAWGDNVAEDEKVQAQPDGSTKPIDLSKRQLRRDFYDNGLFRLDDFIRSCGIEPNGRSYEEVLPELTGAQVLVEVQQYMNQRTSEIGNQIGSLTGAK